MHKYFRIGIVYLFGIVSGYYVCIIIKKYTFLKIDPNISFEINPFEILSLFITILLAIYVTKTLSKQNDLEKSEKELLISYVNNFRSEFDQKITYLLKQDILDTVMTSSDFKIIRKRLDSIIKLAIEYDFIEIPEPFSAQLKSEMRNLWELFTNTPKKANSRSSAAVKDDIERLRLEQRSKIQTTVIDIEQLLFKFAMTINSK